MVFVISHGGLKSELNLKCPLKFVVAATWKLLMRFLTLAHHSFGLRGILVQSFSRWLTRSEVGLCKAVGSCAVIIQWLNPLVHSLFVGVTGDNVDLGGGTWLRGVGPWEVTSGTTSCPWSFLSSFLPCFAASAHHEVTELLCRTLSPCCLCLGTVLKSRCQLTEDRHLPSLELCVPGTFSK